MSMGIFVDKGHKPTSREIASAIGTKRPLWEELIRFLTENYHVKGNLVFGGMSYGWALRYRKGGRALTTIYPAREGFVAQIVIGPTQAEEAFNLDLGENARSVLKGAHPYHDGRWLFIRVGSKRDLADVLQLLALKSPLRGKKVGKAPHEGQHIPHLRTLTPLLKAMPI
jgi:hypothetical protein